MRKLWPETNGKLISIILLPITLCVIGLSINHYDFFLDIREYVQGDAALSLLVKSGKAGKEIRLIEYPLEGSELGLLKLGVEYGFVPESNINGAYPNQRSLPTISIFIDANDLLSSKSGLIPNYAMRGRNWERAAHVSFFHQGKLQLASGVGLRVHGGSSRSMSLKSFRLYFRRLYGAPEVIPGAIFDGQFESLRSVIIHNDVRRGFGEADAEWHFMNPLAYDFAKAIGCIAPETLPVQFFLNGTYQGAYVLTEHLSSDYLMTHYGHDNFVMAKMKNSSRMDVGDRRIFNELKNWSQTASSPLTVSDVREKVELQNLTNWVISILYTGVTDAFQGPAVLDKSDPNAKWFWINWDMDHAFRDAYGTAESPWEIDNFPQRDEYKPRSIIFDRLRRESLEYQGLFLARITKVLNHVLTPEFVRERISFYENTSVSFGIVDRKFIQDIRIYLNNRPAVLREQMNAYFDSGPAYRLSIKSFIDLGLRVDGYNVGAEYSGHYFESTPARIEIPGSKISLVDSWVVNGKSLAATQRIELNLSSDTDIEIIPAESVSTIHQLN